MQDGTKGSDADLDLSGGWYDAGDSLKLTFPFAATVWRLAWAHLDGSAAATGTSFERASNAENGLRQLAWSADYLEKIHPVVNGKTLVAQVQAVSFLLRARPRWQPHTCMCIACCIESNCFVRPMEAAMPGSSSTVQASHEWPSIILTTRRCSATRAAGGRPCAGPQPVCN
jgi:Glycosyl hydrolase family 9